MTGSGKAWTGEAWIGGVLTATHCQLCTNVLTAHVPWTRCEPCGAPLHAKCMKRHGEVYHPEEPVPGAGPYRSRG